MVLYLFSCAIRNGLPCSGNGICSEGVCYCYVGHTGYACEVDDVILTNPVTPVTLPETTCPTVHGLTCNWHGTCVNSKCVCEAPWGGQACEDNPLEQFCDEHWECAECIAFGLDCEVNCTSPSTIYRLVDNITPTAGDMFCRHKSDIMSCSFYYQLSPEQENGDDVVLVQSCPDWLIALTGSSAFLVNVAEDQSTVVPDLFTEVLAETTPLESAFVTQIVTESTRIVTESTTSLAESTPSGDFTSSIESTSLTEELFESRTRIIQLETSSLPNSMVCVCYSIKVLMTCLISFMCFLLITDNKNS